MSSRLPIRRHLYVEPYLAGFPFCESQVRVLDADPISEASYIGSLISGFNEGRCPGIVSGDEVLFGGIECNRRIRIISHSDGLGFVLSCLDREFVFEGGDREACMGKGKRRTEEYGST